MLWNGVDPDLIHRAVRRGTEYRAAKEREIRAVETTRRDIVAYARQAPGEYAATLNIAARNREELEEAMDAIGAWAFGSEGVHELTPTGSPGRVYDAICQSIGQPQTRRGYFATCEVRWMLAEPNKRSAVQSRASTSNSQSLSLWVPGTAEADMEIEVQPKAAAATLTLELDGGTFFVRDQSTAAGQTVRIMMAKGKVELDGADATAETDWQQTRYDTPLTHGQHTLTCNTAAEMTVRWYNRWA